MSTSGCRFLDELGVGVTQTGVRIFLDAVKAEGTTVKYKGRYYTVPELCLKKCPYGDCVLKNIETRETKPVPHKPVTRQLAVKCEGCSDIMHITLKDGRLQRQPRLMQMGDEIYHMQRCGKVKEIRGVE